VTGTVSTCSCSVLNSRSREALLWTVSLIAGGTYSGASPTVALTADELTVTRVLIGFKRGLASNSRP
jgi:hypothetical protein